MRGIRIKEGGESVWSKVAGLLAVVFFLYLGDAILSDWIPVYMQNTLGGSLAMGLMMSFSSIVGFGADLIFPQLFKSVSYRKMIVLAVSAVFITAGILLWTTSFVTPAIFLLAMGTWGIYYEFLYFGTSQFVVKAAPIASRSGVWSIIGVFKSIAYSLGPLIGSWLFAWKGNSVIIFVYVLFGLVAYLIWLFMGMKNGKVEREEVEIEKFNIIEEVDYWIILFEHVWPILLVSLTLGIIDAAFWTTGVVLSDKLVKMNWLAGLFVPAYIVPSIFVGFVVAKMKIFKGKKKLAEIFMLLTGLCTVALGLSASVFWLVFFAFLIGVTTSVAWPMVDAVYSDIANRMGREQKHMLGMSSSTVNLSYITGPVIAGLIASRTGEAGAMMYIGIFVVVISVVLLVVTPKKLKLPQSQIEKWK